MLCYQKDYPRPQFVRGEWINLNGSWAFRFDDENRGEAERWFHGLRNHQPICVPFTYETQLSGIGEEALHPVVWYERTFLACEESLDGHRLLLHFEGSDFITKVWVNGGLAGEHRGGYTRFSFDITELLQEGENRISVKVEDFADPRQPRGKQRWVEESFGCWYVQTTGIWKTVWMEYVPRISLKALKMTPCLTEGGLQVEYELDCPLDVKKELIEVEAVVSFGGQFIARSVVGGGGGAVCCWLDLNVAEQDCPWGIHAWTPENPQLYDVCFRVRADGETCDEVKSYFGMREIRIDGPNILLNGSPIYQRLILDQGYWETSHLTPLNEEALIEDIDKIHQLGYNGLRKHQKLEDERFLYWCDVKGMLVWSEAPAAYLFSDYAVELFTKEWLDIVRQNYNHPCIITWTPFNESWGIPKVKTDGRQQHFTEAIYYLTKSLDPYRPVIVNDGWEHTVSDIITLHDYEETGEVLKKRYTKLQSEILDGRVYHCGSRSAFAKGYSYRGQPIIISEFGGIAFDNETSGWGYGNKVATEEAFLKRFDEITTAIKEIPYVCGYCYTQVTDVQQEINGLLDGKHRFKVPPDKIREVNEKQVEKG